GMPGVQLTAQAGTGFVVHISPAHGTAGSSIPTPKVSAVLSTTKAYWWPATTEGGDEKFAVRGWKPDEAGAGTLSVAIADPSLSSGAPDRSSGRICSEKVESWPDLSTLTVAEVN